ncbi:MAG TPA: hypothetical protein PLF32_01210 [Bacteroidales bacterium]|nr:hypothetical protein [Bacteroidales bacterium]HOR81258.1 hypothetical protein [Bacteroidales bacterium]HPJ90525.1 hypothetical protein [Bacteroidales bacterium]
MKKIIILFLALSSLSVFGQSEEEIINNANDLISNKKYESAFKLLNEFDPSNDKPDIVLLKTDIVLNFFVTSIMHQVFALKDIEKNEDIMDYRGQEGSFTMQMFQADSILQRLIKIYPTNCKLYKGLADYYYDVHLRYEGYWLIDDKELLSLIQTNYQKAIDGNCADYLSHYVLGYINLIQEKFEESIPHFKQSIEMNSNYATSHYNLAYVYFFTEDEKNALHYAKNALNLYEDKEYKSDAARMIAMIYMELKDNTNALTYCEMADKINPEDYYNIRLLLNLYVKTKHEKTLETTKIFFNLAPENPTIYDDLEEIYFSNSKENDLIAFYKSQLNTVKDNKKVQGNLNFYLGRICLDKDKKLAEKYFLNAKKVFKKVYEKDHEVFNAIEEGLKRCKE